MNASELARLKEALEAARADVCAAADAFSVYAVAHEADSTVNGAACDAAVATLVAAVAQLTTARAAYAAARKGNP